MSTPAESATAPAATPVGIGGTPLENFDRAAYQSARTKDGVLAPLPLSLSEALAEAFPEPTP